MSADNVSPNSPQPSSVDVYKPGMDSKLMKGFTPQAAARVDLIDESRQFSIEQAVKEGNSLELHFADNTSMHLTPVWEESKDKPGEKYVTWYAVDGIGDAPEGSWPKRMDIGDGDYMHLSGAGAGTMVKNGVIAEHTPLTFAGRLKLRDFPPEQQADVPDDVWAVADNGDVSKEGRPLLRASAHQFTADVSECILVGADGTRQAIFNPQAAEGTV